MSRQSEIAAAGFSGVAAQAIIGSVAATFTAAGTTQATATALAASKTYITAGAAFTGAILPTGGAGDDYVVCNSTTTNKCVYPPVGYKLNGATVNTPVVMPPNSRLDFDCVDGNNYTAG